MRGTPARRGERGWRRGIIPAYAGNTVSKNWADKDYGDHPRVCGEHIVDSRYRSGLPGSSPRMRGTRRGEHVGQHRQGIIPAYAGNTPY